MQLTEEREEREDTIFTNKCCLSHVRAARGVTSEGGGRAEDAVRGGAHRNH